MFSFALPKDIRCISVP